MGEVTGGVAIARLSVCLSSATFVRPTQAIEIFGNVTTPLGTLAIGDLSISGRGKHTQLDNRSAAYVY